MKITEITAVPVVVPHRPDTVNSPEYDDPLTPLDWKGPSFSSLPKWIYRVRTDEGIEGIGESYRGVARVDVRRNIEALAGRDPMGLNLRALPIPYDRAYDGFEIAIYDLVGKRLGVPVHFLLGGACRDRVLCDWWTGRRTPADIRRVAQRAVQAGYTGLKMKCALGDPHLDRVQAVAEAAGPGFRINLDPNQRLDHPANVRGLARSLEGFNIKCFEDPVPRWNLDWYRLLRETTSIPIALHIHLPYMALGQSIREMIEAIKIEAVDFFNIGAGLAKFVEMAAIADAAGIPVWHGTEADLGILDASCLHACAAAPNCVLGSDIVGFWTREDDLVVEPFEVEPGGYLRVPRGPGLGVSLDEEAVEKYRVEDSV